ncbi:MAG: carboxypeptidase regulatory-like domain-containing protein [Holophagaceae bacterium]|nr:carboxypeptidase regulatory-like domain-containing protein [Holophagaceae bacterium]
MRRIFPLIITSALCLTLAADSTGGISGKVLTKGGQPIPKAVVTLKRTDITYVKELKTDANGKFIQVGLAPVEYDVLVHAEGFVDYMEHFKIPLGELKKKDFTLLSTEEAKLAAPTTAVAVAADPGAQLEDAGYAAFNEATGLYNAKEWKKAEPLFEKAHTSLNESLAKTKDDAAKEQIAEKLKTVSRVYGVVLYEVGKGEKVTAKLDQAKPLLEKAFELNNKDMRVAEALLNISKEKGDKEGEAKYQTAIDAVVGKRPENAYNEGVAAYNANKFKAAKEFILKAIEIDSKFADSYYMLGLIETNNNSMKAAKEAFKKCLELAPTGKHAGECKEFIKAL